jgi:hypothetical protein
MLTIRPQLPGADGHFYGSVSIQRLGHIGAFVALRYLARS